MALSRSLCVILAAWLPTVAAAAEPSRHPSGRPLVIAHRGASGERPEHTIAAYRRALEQAADYVEPDLRRTQDGILVCLHDATLERTTDVAERAEFADRARPDRDGVPRWHPGDFTLAEIRTLRTRQGKPGRSREFDGAETIPTLTELARLVHDHNRQHGTHVGLAPELKDTADAEAFLTWLAEEGRALGADTAVLPLHLQSFDLPTVLAIRPRVAAPVVWLTSKRPSAKQIADLAGHIDGFSLSKKALFGGDAAEKNTATNGNAANENPEPAAAFVRRLHEAGHCVIAWTFADDQFDAGRFGSADTELAAALEAGIDAFFTDFPASGVAARDRLLEPPASAPAAAAQPTGPTAPNIVVFLVDDMGVMDTSVPFLTDADGRPRRYPLNDFYHTPAMERLADRGIRFSTFYAMSVCSPTRVSLLTGQNAARHRTTNWINWRENNGGPLGPPAWNWNGLGRDDVTLPRLLQQAGYRTIHVGKGHFAPRGTPGEDPATLGFDVNIAGSCIGAPATYFGARNFAVRAAGNTPKPAGRRAAGDNAVPGLDKYHGEDIFLTEALTREARAQLTAAVESQTPFFLYFAHYAVHSPFDADPRFAARYADSDKPPPARAFATLVEGVDRSLGDILDHLEALGVASDTLVLFLGDNGTDAPLGHQHAWDCAAPLRGRKGAHYEGGMRVPFIAAWAADDSARPWQRRLPIAAGAIQSQLATVCDLAPTILGLAGIAPPPGHVIDGRPLDTLFTGRHDPDCDETFLMHYPHAPHRSDYFTVWRDGDWKVIYHHVPSDVSGGSHYELFDLREDPFEEHDLAAAEPAELARLMRGLLDACERHGALWPLDPDSKHPRPPSVPAAAGGTVPAPAVSVPAPALRESGGGE